MNRLDRLLKMREADPSDPDIPYMIAQEHAAQNAHDQALALFDDALAIDPHYHYAYYHKARSLVALERVQDAIEVLNEGLRRSQMAGDAKAANEIGAFLAELGA